MFNLPGVVVLVRLVVMGVRERSRGIVVHRLIILQVLRGKRGRKPSADLLLEYVSNFN